jgi:hypothetical protein
VNDLKQKKSAEATPSAAIDPSMYKISVEKRTQSELFCDGMGQSKRTDEGVVNQAEKQCANQVGRRESEI